MPIGHNEWSVVHNGHRIRVENSYFGSAKLFVDGELRDENRGAFAYGEIWLSTTLDDSEDVVEVRFRSTNVTVKAKILVNKKHVCGDQFKDSADEERGGNIPQMGSPNPSDPENESIEFDYSHFNSVWNIIGCSVTMILLGGTPIGEIGIIAIPFVYLAYVISYTLRFGYPFLHGFLIPVAITLPLAMWSYNNEIENGCLGFGFPGSSPCPEKPDGYRDPSTAFFACCLGFLLYGNTIYRSDPVRALGLAHGSLLSVFVFVIASYVGLFS